MGLKFFEKDHPQPLLFNTEQIGDYAFSCRLDFACGVQPKVMSNNGIYNDKFMLW